MVETNIKTLAALIATKGGITYNTKKIFWNILLYLATMWSSLVGMNTWTYPLNCLSYIFTFAHSPLKTIQKDLFSWPNIVFLYCGKKLEFPERLLLTSIFQSAIWELCLCLDKFFSRFIGWSDPVSLFCSVLYLVENSNQCLTFFLDIGEFFATQNCENVCADSFNPLTANVEQALQWWQPSSSFHVDTFISFGLRGALLCLIFKSYASLCNKLIWIWSVCDNLKLQILQNTKFFFPWRHYGHNC